MGYSTVRRELEPTVLVPAVNADRHQDELSSGLELNEHGAIDEQALATRR